MKLMKAMVQKFQLGKVVFTPGAIEAIENAGLAFASAGALLIRHSCGDWGDLDAEDKQANDAAIEREGQPGFEPDRVLSAYHLPNGVKLWIITEWDRSVTTVLLPEDY